jgi:hypothetical protein
VSSLQAHNAAVGYGGMAQIFFFVTLLEVRDGMALRPCARRRCSEMRPCDTREVVSGITIVEMLEGSGRKPGDYSFDPLGFTTVRCVLLWLCV